MTIQENHTAAAPTGDPAIVDTLRRLYDGAMAEADQLASIGGHEREIAHDHLARAADADEAAMAARAYAERWRRHLEYELGGPVDVAGVVEASATVPVRRDNPYGSGPTP